MPEKSPVVYVEGSDDVHSLIHLLGRNGIDYDRKPRPQTFPKFDPRDGVDNVLDMIELSIPLSTERPVGFIVDADTEVLDRWRAVRDRLAGVDVKAPDKPPSQGFIGTSHSTRPVRVSG